MPATNPYRQTVEEAANLLEAESCPCGDAGCTARLDIASCLRSGLAEHERDILAQVIAARALPLPPGSVIAVEAKGEEPSTVLLDAAKQIHAQTGVLVIITTPGRKVEVMPVEEMRAHGWVPAAEVERVREEERERCIGLAANLLAAYRRQFSDPRMGEECRQTIIHALRTPASQEPVPAATCACGDPLRHHRDGTGLCVRIGCGCRAFTPPAATEAGTVCNASRDSGEYRSGDYYSTDLAPPPPPDAGGRRCGDELGPCVCRLPIGHESGHVWEPRRPGSET